MAPALGARHLPALAYLMGRGAGAGPARVTTAEMGRGLGISQQGASRRMAELERGGYVERSGGAVRVTARGRAEVERAAAELSACLSPPRAELRGRLESGMGEGAYYVSARGYARQFRSRLGYAPYPGTLNVRLEGRSHARALEEAAPAGSGVMIDGFSDGRRTYGWVRCHPASIRGVPCHVIRPERTHHDAAVVEVISAECIREACRLRDGSAVTVSVAPG